jgi:peptidoglycan/LPS O-acetylase OafA/YrhL
MNALPETIELPAGTPAPAAEVTPPAPAERTPQQARRLLTIDMLRAFAAISVMAHHLPKFSGPLIILRPWQAIGFIGVGLFLVLSGFSVHYKWALRRADGDFDQRVFWRRRFMRIYPSYLAAAVLAVVVAASVGLVDHPVAPWNHGDSLVPWALAWASQVSVFVANVIPVPALFVSWTIALEFQLYAAYAAVVALVRRFDPVKIVLWALAITLLWRVASQLVVTSIPASGFLPDGNSPLESRFFYSQMPARCFEWFLGMLAVETYVGNVKLPKWTGNLVVPAALMLIVGVVFRHPLGGLSLGGHHFMSTDVMFDPLVGLAFFILINWLVAREDSNLLRFWDARPLRFAAFLGLFSYSIYLVHNTVFMLWDATLNWYGTLAVIVEAVAAVTASWVFFKLVEQHFLKRR